MIIFIKISIFVKCGTFYNIAIFIKCWIFVVEYYVWKIYIINMEIDDQYIKDKFFSKNGRIIKSRINNMTTEENNYIVRRYEDSDSINESLFRIFNNIDTRPVCPICGGKLKFYGRNKAPYSNHCSISCAAIDTAKRTYKERVEKYGCFINIEKAVQTRKNREQYKNEIKKKQTCLERYGDENYVNLEKRHV